MRIERKRGEEILDELQDLLRKDPNKFDEENVHHLRALTRKTETLIDALFSERGKSDFQASERRALKRLRRRAGKVRDADVQMALLQPMPLDGAEDQKKYLLEALDRERLAGIRKLDKFLEAKGAKISKRLDKVRAALAAGASARVRQDGAESVVQEALRHYRELASHPLATADELHDFRKKCKHIRYFVGLAKDTPTARRFAEQLKTIQDAVGSWHDWHAMHALALELGGQRDLTSLILFLGNLEKQRYVEAIQTIDAANAKLGVTSAASGELPRKPQAAAAQVSAAALLA